MEEKKLGEIRIKIGELETKQKNKETCSEQHVCESTFTLRDSKKNIPFIFCSILKRVLRLDSKRPLIGMLLDPERN